MEEFFFICIYEDYLCLYQKCFMNEKLNILVMNVFVYICIIYRCVVVKFII